ncbi:hypothetical protein GUITHDRAFT_162805, partial [Guillardia theta CCMP2712]
MLATFPGSANIDGKATSHQDLLRLMQANNGATMQGNAMLQSGGQQLNMLGQNSQPLPSFVKDFDFWSETEHMKFLAAMKSGFKLELATVALLIGTRTSSQVDSHYKLYMIARQKCLLGSVEGKQEKELSLAEMYNAVGIYNLWIQHQMQRQTIDLTSSSNMNSNNMNNMSSSMGSSNSMGGGSNSSSSNNRSNLLYNSIAGGNVNLSGLQTIGSVSNMQQIGGGSNSINLLVNEQLEHLKKLS